MMNNKLNGNFILNLRKTKELTQEELAEELKVDVKTISRWEHGLNLPTAKSIRKLAKIFELKPSEISDGLSKRDIKAVDRLK